MVVLPAETLTQPVKPAEPQAPVEIATEIKEYGFCTDGNVGSTWDCDRHDEGTDRVENASYHYHNFRKTSMTCLTSVGKTIALPSEVRSVAISSSVTE